MKRVLFAQDVRSLSDWDGRPMGKAALDELIPGSIVRCVVSNESSNQQATEAVYFEIVKYKNGTFWGITLDIYRIDQDYIGLPPGTIFTYCGNSNLLATVECTTTTQETSCVMKDAFLSKI